MKGLSLALTSMVALGVSNYLYKRSTEVMSPVNTTFYYYLFSVCIALVVWVLFREKEPIPKGALVWPALIALCLFVSVFTFNYAIQSIRVSTGATIRSLSFLITILLAVVVSEERLATKDYFAVGLAICAVLLFGYQGSETPVGGEVPSNPNEFAPR